MLKSFDSMLFGQTVLMVSFLLNPKLKVHHEYKLRLLHFLRNLGAECCEQQRRKGGERETNENNHFVEKISNGFLCAIAQYSISDMGSISNKRLLLPPQNSMNQCAHISSSFPLCM